MNCWHIIVERVIDFLDKNVTGNGSLIHHNYLNSKWTSTEFKHPSSPSVQKSKIQSPAGKVMFIACLNVKRPVR